MTKPLDIWVISEGIAGTENQCLGIAEALNGQITVKRIGLKWPFVWISPYLSWGEGPGMLTATRDPIAPPYPDVVIAGGRKAMGIARYIRRVTHGKTIVCVVQHPRVNPNAFDLVAVPYHDGLTGPNVMATDGACNRITPDLLNTARDKWRTLITALPVPRVAVLVGGNSKTHRLNAATMDKLIAHLQDTQRQYKTSLMITVSRRTPPDLAQKLVAAFTPCHPGAGRDPVPVSNQTPAYAGVTSIVYTGQGDNPYTGFLAFADYFICTTDSVSMISDAASVGKPIDLFSLPGGTPRHIRFLNHLHDLGIGIDCRDYIPLNDAQKVAERIKKLIKKETT
jgi:uncharacterized protein